MAFKSKKEDVLELFYNYPTKHWHFTELREKTGLPDSKLAKWLNKLQEEKTILRKKPEKEMPHYISNQFSPFFQSKKKLFALSGLYESGLIDHLVSLKKPKAVFIFGSMVRWDWVWESDIDLFIYGDDDGLSTHEYERKLGREIQVFVCRENQLEKFNPGLLRNIMQGMLVSGELSKELMQHATKYEVGR